MQLQITYLPTWLFVTVAFFIGGLAVGLCQHRYGKRRKGQHSRRVLEVPQVWPFDPRRLASFDEREVWAWLRATFPEHQVLPKLPLTRFVSPQRPDRARAWQQLLAGVSCSFTVCADDGRVIGCLDVMAGPDALPRINRQIKETLLDQCGINYWAVLRDRLPHGEILRAEFLGSDARVLDVQPRTSPIVPIEDARQRLHQTLDRNRAWRARNTIPAPLESLPMGLSPSGFPLTQPSDFAALSQPMRRTHLHRRRTGLSVI